MHTTALDSCRIHHDGDFEGEIIITNSDSTSKPIGEIRTIKFTTRKMVNLYERTAPGVVQISILGNSEEGYDREITILMKDIESFLGYRLLQKIEEKLENAEYGVISDVANLLGIR